MKMLIAIAAGGALGALGRHLFAAQVMRWTGSGGFPWGILACNVLGSAVMGFLIHWLATLPEPMPGLRAFLTVGVLGAFTTFSAYALDIVLLAEREEFGAAAGYAAGSVLFSVLGLLAGLALARAVLA